MAEIGIGNSLGGFAPKLGDLSEIAKKSPAAPAGPSTAQTGASFMETLKSQFVDTNQAIQSADAAARDSAAGKNVSLHDAMISMEKAELSLRSLVAVRGKVIEAYQEIMRMPV